MKLLDFEVSNDYPEPDKALSDGPNMWLLDKMEELLGLLLELDRVVKKQR